MKLETKCPVCLQTASTEPGVDRQRFTCNSCGKFDTTGTAIELLLRSAGWGSDEAKQRKSASSLLRRGGIGSDLTSESVRRLWEAPGLSRLEQATALLLAISKAQGTDGNEVIVNRDANWMALSGCTDLRQLDRAFDHLMENSLVRGRRSDLVDGSLVGYAEMTVPGDQFLNRAGQANVHSKQGFIAMAFDGVLDEANSAFHHAVEAAGYRPLRCDDIQYCDRIDERILREIERSRFVIADLTFHKAGVYFEAGFARGLGIPVVWSCRRDQFGGAHFDVRQYNHVVWEDEKQLVEQVKKRIVETPEIGRG